MTKPVENIYWNNPPKGKYRIIVSCYLRRDTVEGGIPYKVIVQDSTHGKSSLYEDEITSTKHFEEIPLNLEI